MQENSAIAHLSNLFAQQPNIELALLIGSRALGQAREESDWDFAVQWRRDIPWEELLEYKVGASKRGGGTGYPGIGL